MIDHFRDNFNISMLITKKIAYETKKNINNN